mmetsp:Transcript_29049/g.56823  ORF Transcript_29049/g.56823 Transcript_29049/m.56823 type:complete len:190 (+) Transcript_29049:506-1075(+)
MARSRCISGGSMLRFVVQAQEEGKEAARKQSCCTHGIRASTNAKKVLHEPNFQPARDFGRWLRAHEEDTRREHGSAWVRLWCTCRSCRLRQHGWGLEFRLQYDSESDGERCLSDRSAECHLGSDLRYQGNFACTVHLMRLKYNYCQWDTGCKNIVLLLSAVWLFPVLPSATKIADVACGTSHPSASNHH